MTYAADDFWLGLYGNWDQVVMLKSNGYINATWLCAQGDKPFDLWFLEPGTKALIDACRDLLSTEPVITILYPNPRMQGTYVHPLLIPHITTWVSAEFALRVGSTLTNIHHYFQSRLRVK